MNKTLVALARWLIVLAMPVAIVLLSARVMVNTWYPRFEYARPDFPPDRYGFTDAERLEFATVSIDYLNAPAPPEEAIMMLVRLRLPGTLEPLFLPYELNHMIDVKRLTDTLWQVLVAAGAIVLAGVVGLLARRATRPDGYAALFVGGALTSGLLMVLIVLVLLSWRWFFIAFHDVFFPPGTWTFDWTDSLIRLFPDRFWFDAGVLLVGGALVLALVVTGVGFLLGRRENVRREDVST